MQHHLHTPLIMLTTSDAGNYRVIVNGTSPCSPLTSSTATLVVSDPIVVTTPPESLSVCISFPASFTVVATGSNLTYEWYKNGISTGITTPTLNISQAAISDAGTYYVIVSGGAGCPTVRSNDVTLGVILDIDITGQPVSQTICEGGNITFSVTTTGSIDSYVWRRNGIPVSGGNYSGDNTANLKITGVTCCKCRQL